MEEIREGYEEARADLNAGEKREVAFPPGNALNCGVS